MSFLYLSRRRGIAVPSVQIFVVLGAVADLLAIGIDPELHTSRLAARGERHQVGELDARFLLDDAARLVGGGRAGVTLDEIQLLDQRARPIIGEAEDLALLPLFLARNDADLVALLDALHRSVL